MASVLKTLALAAGAGIAVGLCTTAGNRRSPVRQENARPETGSRSAPRDILDIEPLLDRLEKMERRFEAVPVTQLTVRLEAQEAEIARLKALVDTRSVEIEQRLEAEIERRHTEALASIETTVELRVSQRIAAIERTLMEQSASIDSLRDRALETDSNLKRLIAAIEKLCERTQPVAAAESVPVPPPIPAAPGPQIVPFESHLAEARAKQEEVGYELRAKIFKEPEPEPRKQRFPLARIFGMIALVVLTQVLSS